MKRVGISLASGVTVMLVLGACVAFSNRQSVLESVFLWMLAFPLLIFDRFFPPHPDPGDLFPGFPSPEALIATGVFDVLFYSCMAYIILRQLESRKRGAD